MLLRLVLGTQESRLESQRWKKGMLLQEPLSICSKSIEMVNYAQILVLGLSHRLEAHTRESEPTNKKEPQSESYMCVLSHVLCMLPSLCVCV